MNDPRKNQDYDALRGYSANHGADAADLGRLDAVLSRRRFLGLTGKGGALALLAGFGAGAEPALEGLFRRGLIPAAWGRQDTGAPASPNAAQKGSGGIAGKSGMNVLVSEPINGEFPPHLLDDDITPPERHFVRNNGGVPPRAASHDPQGWKLVIDGEVHRPLELSLDDLKRMPAVRLSLVVECAGNGRAFFEPPVRGNPWSHGAVACGAWTGVRLRDVLQRAGLKPSARYTAHYGEDAPIGQAQPFSRGVPVDKAMDEHTLIAYQLGGRDIPALNGYPARLVVPGWIGSCSQKWLNRIWVRDREHDSEKMTGYSYRVPARPVAPGSRPPSSEMVVATSLPIKSMITRPMAGVVLKTGERQLVRGHAWAGETSVARVAVSTDFGVRWQDARLSPNANKYAWQTWETEVAFAERGYYEIWARAFDDRGNAQPFRQPWNPKGYLGNVIHRVPVRVEG